MTAAIDIFDYCQTIGVTIALTLTLPIACFVYFKLLFFKPFSESYTFKLIVLNGMVELLNTLSYLISYQLTSYSFALDFYHAIQNSGLATPLAIVNALLGGLSLHSSFFIAINRTKTMLLFHKQTNDFAIFIVSVILMFLFTLPGVLDFLVFTTSSYNEVVIGGETVLFPGLNITNEFFRTFNNVLRTVVSLATLLVNLFLVWLITRERKFTNIYDKKKFNAEKGLVITSIISYATYMVHFSNGLISRYFKVTFCSYAQWMFLGIYSLSPFWCLIAFTPSVRRVLTGGRGSTVEPTHIQTRTAH